LPRYVASVPAWAKHGARLLLWSRARRAARVPELFGPYFEIVRTQASTSTRSAGRLPRTIVDGQTIWMIRRPAAHVGKAP